MKVVKHKLYEDKVYGTGVVKVIGFGKYSRSRTIIYRRVKDNVKGVLLESAFLTDFKLVTSEVL